MLDAQWHQPVMSQQALDLLGVTPGGRYCDGTVGGGGHAQQILQRSAPGGWLLGVDRDPQALARSQQTLALHGDRFTLAQGSFAELGRLLQEQGVAAVDGILLDLGVSSHQLDTPGRGFSFAAEGPLDMRMCPTAGPTAAELLAQTPTDELAALIREYGEQPGSRRIARAIKAALDRGALRSTTQLAQVVASAVPRPAGRRPAIHPATRTFQALRMAVNGELQHLEAFLRSFCDLLVQGGRVVIIAFHSLEDRRVKETFRHLARGCVCPPDLPICACDHRPSLRVLTRRPLRAEPDEVQANPRSRSARLRAAERL